MTDPCDKYYGRLRDLCRGHDDSGQTLDLPAVTIEKYKRFFQCGEYDRRLAIVRRQSRGPVSEEQRHESRKKRLAKFHQLWAELHDCFGFGEHEWSPAVVQQRFEQWNNEIPSFGCACQKHWKDIVKVLPPDFSSRAAFYGWSVKAHNRVNEMLGKPLWELG